MSEQERREPAWSDDPGQLSAEATISVDEQPAGPTVGERIRQGREAAGLSAADLAQPLNLDLRVIENIERDALDDVPGRPYILAYLRAWAGQLGIDAEALIEQYNRQQGAGHGEIQGGQHPTLDVMESRGGGGGWGRFLGWFLALVVAAIVLLALLQVGGERLPGWWQDLVGSEEQRDDADGVERPEPESGIELSEPEGEAERGPGEDEALERPPAPGLREQEAAAPASLDARLPEARLSALGEAEGDARAAASAGDEPRAESEARPEPETQPESETEGSAAEAPGLVLRAVGGESWVEIRDSAGDRLMYDVLADGESRDFEGEGPFALVLGNPDVLEVEYAGEPVELGDEDGSDGVLRVTVGDS